jgi:[ribosomal protein S18]-alanine N-acetyltransferase
MTDPERIKKDVIIRPMTRSDIPAIVLIESRIFPDPWPSVAFEEELDNDSRGIIVAEAGGVIVGYAGYIIGPGEAHLTNIGVAPEFRGNAIAKNLLNSILEISRKGECDYIFLDVRPSNTAAINLYNQFGFFELYRRPKYYRMPPEDAVVMVKTLTDESQ